MLSRRQLVKRLAAYSSAVALSAFPWKLELGGFTIAYQVQSALAQGNGAGNGNAGGNGDSNGAGKGRGNAGGNSNGNGGGKGNGNSGKGNGNGKGSGKSTGAAPPADAPESPNAPVDVRHEDGIQESIRNGRYIMRDRQGRVIIDRKATFKDRFRLHSFLD